MIDLNKAGAVIAQDIAQDMQNGEKAAGAVLAMIAQLYEASTQSDQAGLRACFQVLDDARLGWHDEALRQQAFAGQHASRVHGVEENEALQPACAREEATPPWNEPVEFLQPTRAREEMLALAREVEADQTERSETNE